MYNKILIISDNLFLCYNFESIISNLDIQNVQWTYAISPFSNVDIFREKLKKVEIRNLKKEEDIEFICQNFNLVLSIHCKQIFPDKLINSVKCINLHPGFNPINRGWYPQVFAIINQTEIGATIHEIDSKLDHGNIIDRGLVKQNSWDTSFSLYNKVVELEIDLLKNNLQNIIENSYKSIIPENEGNLYLKKDFNELCELNLNKYQTIKESLDLLRALTHGEYKNAYYIDIETGKKVYVSIEFKEG